MTDLQTTTKLGSSCVGTWGTMWTSVPTGFYIDGGPAPGIHLLRIEGCATANTGSQGVRVLADNADAPSTYLGSVGYQDAQGQVWATMGDSAKITLDKIGPVGDVIEGSYVTKVYNGVGVMDLAGSFRVCHVEDENL